MTGLPPARPPFPVVSPYRVVPAPRPLGDLPHVVLDDSYPAALSRRMERLTTDPDGILVRDQDDPDDEGLAAALRSAWDLLPLPREGPLVTVPLLGAVVDVARGTARASGPSAYPAATAALLQRSGLNLLATGWQLACADDLVILRRRAPGVVTAELLAVAFPSGWPPRRCGGATLQQLHAPVPDGDRLQRAAPALSEALLVKGPYLQHVWGLNPDGRLDRDPSAPDAPRPAAPPPPPDQWFLRVERQTTAPLPQSGRAAFTIRPFLVSLTRLSRPQRATLASAVTSMGPAALAYKGIDGVRDALLAWL